MAKGAGMGEPSPAWSVAAVIERIGSFLSENDVACTLRQLNKLTASVLCGRTKVCMSKPSPPHAFARRWGATGAMRSLTCKQRQLLLQLTATSGSVPNLQIALASVGCLPAAEALAAAAAAGHIQACEVLISAGCPWSNEVLDAAARAGRRDSVEWLLRAGCPPGPQLLAAAAGAGHSELCEWLIDEAGLSLVWDADAVSAAGRGGFVALFEAAVAQLLGGGSRAGATAATNTAAGAMAPTAAARPVVLGKVLEGAAEGCDLDMLVWLHHTWLDSDPDPTMDPPQPQAQPQGQAQGQGNPQLSNAAREAIVAAAAASPTPDWRAKVEWLRARGYPASRTACSRAAALPDGLARIAWLREQQPAFVLEGITLAAAVVKARRADLLDFFAASATATAPIGLNRLGSLAEAEADLGFWRMLHERGVRLRGAPCLIQAAAAGSVVAVKWVLETFGEEAAAGAGGGRGGGRGGAAARPTAKVAAAGAASGSVEMMAWLRARGYGWDARAVVAAAGAGCEEQIEWLVAEGCPLGDDGEAYVRAARNGDLATMKLLRRLGCPWGPPGSVFTAAVAWASGLAVLGWLLEAGCPVDWEEALEAARLRQRPPGVEQWLAIPTPALRAVEFLDVSLRPSVWRRRCCTGTASLTPRTAPPYRQTAAHVARRGSWPGRSGTVKPTVHENSDTA